MQLELPGQPHLTYCTNIHAGETWDEIEAALTRFLPAVKREISPEQPMGVGLRLSALAATQLAQPVVLARFKDMLWRGGLYVFTVNAFPYGAFHGQRVKERVYEPDWRTPERLAFTNEVADLLAEIGPRGMDLSISTVPGGFRGEIRSDGDIARIVEGYVRAAAHLHGIAARAGRTILLAIEPEPACFLETTREAIGFLNDRVFTRSACALFVTLTGVPLAEAEGLLRRHLGLCFDVCHSAVAFEDAEAILAAVRSSGITIGKIQLSAALSADGAPSQFEELLGRFDDGIYLHQTVQRRDGALTRHTDLSEAFDAARRGEAGGEWRVHCHVPVFVDRFEGLRSTQRELREVLAVCRRESVSPHLEVETYTWDVLPKALRSPEIVGDIVRELRWVRRELGV